MVVVGSYRPHQLVHAVATCDDAEVDAWLRASLGAYAGMTGRLLLALARDRRIGVAAAFQKLTQVGFAMGASHLEVVAGVTSSSLPAPSLAEFELAAAHWPKLGSDAKAWWAARFVAFWSSRFGADLSGELLLRLRPVWSYAHPTQKQRLPPARACGLGWPQKETLALLESHVDLSGDTADLVRELLERGMLPAPLVAAHPGLLAGALLVKPEWAVARLLTGEVSVVKPQATLALMVSKALAASLAGGGGKEGGGGGELSTQAVRHLGRFIEALEHVRAATNALAACVQPLLAPLQKLKSEARAPLLLRLSRYYVVPEEERASSGPDGASSARAEVPRGVGAQGGSLTAKDAADEAAGEGGSKGETDSLGGTEALGTLGTVDRSTSANDGVGGSSGAWASSTAIVYSFDRFLDCALRFISLDELIASVCPCRAWPVSRCLRARFGAWVRAQLNAPQQTAQLLTLCERWLPVLCAPDEALALWLELVQAASSWSFTLCSMAHVQALFPEEDEKVPERVTSLLAAEARAFPAARREAIERVLARGCPRHFARAFGIGRYLELGKKGSGRPAASQAAAISLVPRTTAGSAAAMATAAAAHTADVEGSTAAEREREGAAWLHDSAAWLNDSLQPPAALALALGRHGAMHRSKTKEEFALLCDWVNNLEPMLFAPSSAERSEAAGRVSALLCAPWSDRASLSKLCETFAAKLLLCALATAEAGELVAFVAKCPHLPGGGSKRAFLACHLLPKVGATAAAAAAERRCSGGGGLGGALSGVGGGGGVGEGLTGALSILEPLLAAHISTAAELAELLAAAGAAGATVSGPVEDLWFALLDKEPTAAARVLALRALPAGLRIRTPSGTDARDECIDAEQWARCAASADSQPPGLASPATPAGAPSAGEKAVPMEPGCGVFARFGARGQEAVHAFLKGPCGAQELLAMVADGDEAWRAACRSAVVSCWAPLAPPSPALQASQAEAAQGGAGGSLHEAAAADGGKAQADEVRALLELLDFYPELHARCAPLIWAHGSAEQVERAQRGRALELDALPRRWWGCVDWKRATEANLATLAAAGVAVPLAKVGFGALGWPTQQALLDSLEAETAAAAADAASAAASDRPMAPPEASQVGRGGKPAGGTSARPMSKAEQAAERLRLARLAELDACAAFAPQAKGPIDRYLSRFFELLPAVEADLALRGDGVSAEERFASGRNKALHSLLIAVRERAKAGNFLHSSEQQLLFAGCANRPAAGAGADGSMSEACAEQAASEFGSAGAAKSRADKGKGKGKGASAAAASDADGSVRAFDARALDTTNSAVLADLLEAKHVDVEHVAQIVRHVLMAADGSFLVCVRDSALRAMLRLRLAERDALHRSLLEGGAPLPLQTLFALSVTTLHEEVIPLVSARLRTLSAKRWEELLTLIAEANPASGDSAPHTFPRSLRAEFAERFLQRYLRGEGAASGHARDPRFFQLFVACTEPSHVARHVLAMLASQRHALASILLDALVELTPLELREVTEFVAPAEWPVRLRWILERVRALSSPLVGRAVRVHGGRLPDAQGTVLSYDYGKAVYRVQLDAPAGGAPDSGAVELQASALSLVADGQSAHVPAAYNVAELLGCALEALGRPELAEHAPALLGAMLGPTHADIMRELLASAEARAVVRARLAAIDAQRGGASANDRSAWVSFFALCWAAGAHYTQAELSRALALHKTPLMRAEVTALGIDTDARKLLIMLAPAHAVPLFGFAVLTADPSFAAALSDAQLSSIAQLSAKDDADWPVCRQVVAHVRPSMALRLAIALLRSSREAQDLALLSRAFVAADSFTRKQTFLPTALSPVWKAMGKQIQQAIDAAVGAEDDAMAARLSAFTSAGCDVGKRFP